jgi:GcrA cell cycle regulator
MIALAINEIFGTACTRNSIIGIAFRLRLKKGMGRHPLHELKQTRPKRGPMMKIKPAWKPRPEYRGRPVSGIQCPCQIVDLESWNCHWPVGDPREPSFYFCGAVVVSDRQYCPTHIKLAFGREAA